jgi:thioredoxin 1
MDIFNQNSFLISVLCIVLAIIFSVLFWGFKREIIIGLGGLSLILGILFLIGFSSETKYVVSENELDIISINENQTVLQFYSNLCLMCLSVKPLVDKLESEFSGKVNFHRINIQSNKGKRLAERYNVTLVPTFIFISKTGKIIYRKSGTVPKKDDFISLVKDP